MAKEGAKAIGNSCFVAAIASLFAIMATTDFVALAIKDYNCNL